MEGLTFLVLTYQREVRSPLVRPPAVVYQQYNVYAPQTLDAHMTQVRMEVQELEARAEVIHRQSLESVDEPKETTLSRQLPSSNSCLELDESPKNEYL